MFAEARRLCAPTLKRGARLPIRAVSYEAAIDQLFKRMRSSSSARTKQAVSTPRGPVPNERLPLRINWFDQEIADQADDQHAGQNVERVVVKVIPWHAGGELRFANVVHHHRTDDACR